MKFRILTKSPWQTAGWILGRLMDVRSTSKSGPQVALPAAVIEEVTRQLRDQHPEWLRQLSDHPERFADLELQVHQHFRSVADQLVASLLAQASASPAVDAAQKK